MTDIWLHYSDCAMHNEPAYPNGPCSCNRPAELAEENVKLKDAISAHLDIITGRITGGVASPTLVMVSALDLRRLVTPNG